MKIYIAGKITGDKRYRAKFGKVAKKLEAHGSTVLNPAILPAGLDQADYMRICLAMLDSADMAMFLPDFWESEGAMVEWDYCGKVGKPRSIYEAEGFVKGVAET